MVLTFEFCRTEEVCCGCEIASITRLTTNGRYTYRARVLDSWRELLNGEHPSRVVYVEEFIRNLSSATQHALDDLFREGAEVSSGPIRGRLETY